MSFVKNVEVRSYFRNELLINFNSREFISTQDVVISLTNFFNYCLRRGQVPCLLHDLDINSLEDYQVISFEGDMIEFYSYATFLQTSYGYGISSPLLVYVKEMIGVDKLLKFYYAKQNGEEVFFDCYDPKEDKKYVIINSALSTKKLSDRLYMKSFQHLLSYLDNEPIARYVINSVFSRKITGKTPIISLNLSGNTVVKSHQGVEKESSESDKIGQADVIYVLGHCFHGSFSLASNDDDLICQFNDLARYIVTSRIKHKGYVTQFPIEFKVSIIGCFSTYFAHRLFKIISIFYPGVTVIGRHGLSIPLPTGHTLNMFKSYIPTSEKQGFLRQYFFKIGKVDVQLPYDKYQVYKFLLKHGRLDTPTLLEIFLPDIEEMTLRDTRISKHIKYQEEVPFENYKIAESNINTVTYYKGWIYKLYRERRLNDDLLNQAKQLLRSNFS